MLRSLFSGISGLRAHQTMIDVTGNNIANVNTTGFKSSQTQFQDTLSQMLQRRRRPAGQHGGTNPAQVGLGVRVAGITTNFTQGAAQQHRPQHRHDDPGRRLLRRPQAATRRSTPAPGRSTSTPTATLVTGEGCMVQGWQADAVERRRSDTNGPPATSSCRSAR